MGSGQKDTVLRQSQQNEENMKTTAHGLTLPEFPLLIGRHEPENQLKLKRWLRAAKKRVCECACTLEDKGVIMLSMVDLEYAPQPPAVRTLVNALVSEIESKPDILAELMDLAAMPQFAEAPVIRKYWAGVWALQRPVVADSSSSDESMLRV